VINSKLDLRRGRNKHLEIDEESVQKSRAIAHGPLFELKALQGLLRRGEFDTGRLRPANRDVMKDMQRARWSAHDVLQMLVNMHAKDYKKSEWARIDAGRRWVPCDVYLTLYDSFTRRRCPNAPSVYLKFSIDEAGDVTILLASCHGST
jgi:hypothetical protein